MDLSTVVLRRLHLRLILYVISLKARDGVADGMSDDCDGTELLSTPPPGSDCTLFFFQVQNAMLIHCKMSLNTVMNILFLFWRTPGGTVVL